MALDALDLIEAESRERMRALGVDATSLSVESLVRDVLIGYEVRAGRGEVPVLRNPDSVVEDVAARIGGFGALQPLLDDPTVEEIWINSPSEVFISRGGVSELTPIVLTEAQVRGLVERMLASSGRRIDLSTPFVDALLPDGSRLHAVIPQVTRANIAVNIRKFIARAHSLPDLVTLGSLTEQAAGFLHAAVRSGLNVLVSGSTGSGKTTLLNCLGASCGPRERIITIEEVFELNIRARDVVAMQTRQASLEGTGEITMRRLVKETLRMRPSRIIVGEVREAESLDMLIALNSGLAGMATVHANSARDAISKLCILPLLAGENVTSQFVVPTVASALDIIVHLDHLADGRRRVREIAAVPGRVEHGAVELEMLFSTHQGRLIRADGFPPQREKFAQAGFDLTELLGQAA